MRRIACILIVAVGCQMSRYVETNELRKLAESKVVLTDTRGESFVLTRDDALFLQRRDGGEISVAFATVRIENGQLLGQGGGGEPVSMPLEAISRARVISSNRGSMVGLVFVIVLLVTVVVLGIGRENRQL